MSFRARHVTATTLPIILLASCSFQPVVSKHAVDYNRAVEQADNRLVLINILRAKDRRPFHFTSLQQIKGSLSGEASLSLSIPFGRNPTNSFSATPGVTLKSNPIFDVSVLNTQEFMRGFLNPVSMQTIDLYWQQGWQSEVLLHLFVERIEVQTRDSNKKKWKTIGNVYNSPESSRSMPPTNCNALRDKIEKTRKLGVRNKNTKFNINIVRSFKKIQKWQILYGKACQSDRNLFHYYIQNLGISIGRRRNTTGAGPRIKADQAIQLFKHLSNTNNQSLAIRWITGTNEFRVLSNPIIFCVGSQMPNPRSRPSSDVECDEPADDKLGLKLVFHLRSPSGLLVYLGEIVRAYDLATSSSQRQRAVARFVTDGNPRKQAVLFFARRSKSTDQPGALSMTYRGHRYVIPERVAEFPKQSNRSMQIISLVSQIIALQRKAQQAPRTQTVRIIGQ